MLADHGKTVETLEKFHPVPMPRLTRVQAEALPTELMESTTAPGSDGRQLIPPRYQPVLRGRPLTHAAPFPYFDETDQPRSARAAMPTIGKPFCPAIGSLVSTFNSVQMEWTVTRDLLTDSLGRPDYAWKWSRMGRPRFDSETAGWASAGAGSLFQIVYRVGNGSQGNIGADTLRHVVTDNPHVAGVTNPLPAFGGTEPESLKKFGETHPWLAPVIARQPWTIMRR